MQFLPENKRILEKKYPEILEKSEQYEPDENIIVEKKGQNIYFGINRNEYTWSINSKIDGEYAAKLYAERYKPLRIFGNYFIFGFSDGQTIRELIQDADESVGFMIYEPCFELFLQICCNVNIADILERDKVTLFIPGVNDYFDKIYILSYAETKVLEFCILPNYDVLFLEDCQKYMDIILDQIRTSLVNTSTKSYFNRLITKNMFYNIRQTIVQRNIRQIKNVIDPEQIKNVPAIIVSAGPSLDKNVEELKRAKGKSFIIVVDAALRTVLKTGIIPDLVCTADPETPERFFENVTDQTLMIACGRITRPWVIEHFGKHVFYHSDFGIWTEILEEVLGYRFPDMPGGGSVSADAFMIATYLGFRTIVFIGQDLAFTNGKSHTQGIEGVLGENDSYIKQRYLMKVEGIHGEDLETDYQMWFYKKWFEKRIEANEGILKVINATEGGAKLEGAEHRVFREVIDELCKKEIDFYNRIESIPPAFTMEQQSILLEKINEIPKEIETLEDKIDHVISLQEKTLELIEKEKISKQVKNNLKIIFEENEKVEQNKMLQFLSYYAAEEERELSEKIYAQQDMDIEELVRNSFKLFQGYKKNIKTLKEDVDQYLCQGICPDESQQA